MSNAAKKSARPVTAKQVARFKAIRASKARAQAASNDNANNDNGAMPAELLAMCVDASCMAPRDY